MRRKQRLEQGRLEEQARQNKVEQRSEKFADFGCLAIMLVVLFGAFLLMTGVSAQAIKFWASSLPFWLCLIFGAICSLALMALQLLFEKTLMELVIRIVIVAVMFSILTQVFQNARENAIRRNHQKTQGQMPSPK